VPGFARRCATTALGPTRRFACRTPNALSRPSVQGFGAVSDCPSKLGEGRPAAHDPQLFKRRGLKAKAICGFGRGEPKAVYQGNSPSMPNLFSQASAKMDAPAAPVPEQAAQALFALFAPTGSSEQGVAANRFELVQTKMSSDGQL
jgi:hypothetical protein